MFCLKCGNSLNGNEEYCPNCGSKVLPDANSQSSSNIVLEKNNFKFANNRKKVLICIVFIILVLSICLCLIWVFLKNGKKDEGILQPIQTKKSDVVLYESSLSKLKQDFENGTINVEKYFSELVNYDYDSKNFDKKYISNNQLYTTGNISDIVEVLEKYRNQLSKETIKKLIENATLQNVILGPDLKVEQQKNSLLNVEVTPLANSDEQSKIANHRLNKVHLSRNKHFLIWYSNVGDDSVTESELLAISNELESSISDYEGIFNIDYLYKPYYDELINKNYFNAREVLKTNGINPSKIDTAMNVYIYNTGSESTLASYYNPYDTSVLLDTALLLGIDDLFLGESGIVSYPYIVINKKIINESAENVETVANHELFHHFQHLYCAGVEKHKCSNGYYLEATANLASALVSEVSSPNTFLNGWAGVFTLLSSDVLSVKGEGYGQFPYYYVYTTEVNDWAVILTSALNEDNPVEYIKNNTRPEDLVKISETIAYNTLAKKYDNLLLYSNYDVVPNEIITSPKEFDKTINAGAIDYYEVSGNNVLEVNSGNNAYVGIKLYGYKDGNYTEITSSMDKINEDLTYYVRYDKFYVAIYNADISGPYTYTLKVSNAKYAENKEFVTTFNNYNIEVEMDITIAGISTNTVSKGIVDELHQKEYLDVTTTSMGLISLNNKIYYDFNTGYSYMTQPYGGDVWWKEKNVSQMVDLKMILNQLLSMKNVDKISDNHYKVKMTQSDVKGLIESSDANIVTLKDDIYVDVYTEQGYITKLEYDFSNLIEGIDAFTTSILYSNYDSAGDVEIPQSIIDNAQMQ